MENNMSNTFSTINNTSQLELNANQSLDGHQAKLNINFMRTLRIPDDNKKYNLPPGLGSFPLKHVEDYKNVPENWQEHGGIFLPMYQSEALWLRFDCQWPFAIKVAAGKINAVSGEQWQADLAKSIEQQPQIAHDLLLRSPEEQNKYEEDYKKITSAVLPVKKESNHDYMVAPKQPWLDGFNVGKGLIRQFVAMPLGDGYSVEEQITGKAEHGGIQIIAYPMKAEYYKRILDEQAKSRSIYAGASLNGGLEMCASASVASKGVLRSATAKPQMGLGAGGFMKQEIYDDPYGIDAWDTTKPIRIFVHLLNSLEYQNVTGEAPPTKPLGPKEYSQYNYPWFDYYSDGKVLDGSDKLAKVDSIASLGVKKDENPLEDNTSIPTPKPHIIGQKSIKNGNW